MNTTITRVVAGIDGSPRADAVAEAAGHWADRLAVPLLLVTVHGTVDAAARAAIHPGASSGADASRLKAALDELAQHLAGRWPRLDITTETPVGAVASTLVELLEETDLLVIGDRGWGRLAALLARPMADRVVRRAPGPVLIIPEQAASPTADPIRLDHRAVLSRDSFKHATSPTLVVPATSGDGKSER